MLLTVAIGLLAAGTTSGVLALLLGLLVGRGADGRLDLRRRSGVSLAVFALATGGGAALGLGLVTAVAHLLWQAGAAAAAQLSPLRLAALSAALLLVPALLALASRGNRRVQPAALTLLSIVAGLLAGVAALGLLASLLWALVRAWR